MPSAGTPVEVMRCTKVGDCCARDIVTRLRAGPGGRGRAGWAVWLDEVDMALGPRAVKVGAPLECTHAQMGPGVFEKEKQELAHM